MIIKAFPVRVGLVPQRVQMPRGSVLLCVTPRRAEAAIDPERFVGDLHALVDPTEPKILRRIFVGRTGWNVVDIEKFNYVGTYIDDVGPCHVFASPEEIEACSSDC